ncbi:MAG: hypothetical protein B7733_16615 [Myxococcales bacterium FL481]|nr:MAG: hypothetical protein B7733_16615 [Myxococcales bacterium FL481]
MYVAAGGVTGLVISSLEGETWAEDTTESHGTQSPGHTRNLLRGIAYGGGVFVAVGGNDNAYLSASCDGVTWRHDLLTTNVDGDIPADYAMFLSGVAYGEGTFVAVGGGGLTLRSTDHGHTWHKANTAFDGIFRNVVYGNGRFVAAGAYWSGTEGSWSTSADGLEWSAPGQGFDGLDTGLAFAAGRFMAIGRQACVFSTDGDTWTPCATSNDADKLSLAALDDAFWVQHLDGTIWRSTDGETWDEPRSGWLPSAVADGPDRWVGAYDTSRGYTVDGTSWTTFPFPNSDLRGMTVGVVRLGE